MNTTCRQRKLVNKLPSIGDLGQTDRERSRVEMQTRGPVLPLGKSLRLTDYRQNKLPLRACLTLMIMLGRSS